MNKIVLKNDADIKKYVSGLTLTDVEVKSTDVSITITFQTDTQIPIMYLKHIVSLIPCTRQFNMGVKDGKLFMIIWLKVYEGDIDYGKTEI